MFDDAFICGNNYTFYIEALLPSFLLGVLCFTFWFSSTKVNLFLDSFSLKETTLCTNRLIQILLKSPWKVMVSTKNCHDTFYYIYSLCNHFDLEPIESYVLILYAYIPKKSFNDLVMYRFFELKERCPILI
ncbi:hypothetical protein ACB092_04G193900 [Castanea dentata]